MKHRIDDVERNYYTILGVDRAAPLDELRAAHRRLARVLHPDANANNSAHERALAERRMREVNEAWSVLSDPAERHSYDEALAAAEIRDAAARAAGQEPGAGTDRGPSSGTRSSTAGTRPNGPLPDNFDNADPVFRRAFQRSTGDGTGSGEPGGGTADALHFDAPEMTEDDRRRLNLRTLVVVAVLIVGAVVFLIVTAYAGGVDDPASTVPVTSDPVSSTVEPAD